MSTGRPAIGARADYKHFLKIPTRWMDNDVYGHVNNVNYYSYFDTVINRYLIDEGRLDFHNSPIIGLAVESLCRYHKSFTYPDLIDAGLRVGRLGKSSVRYEIGLFAEGEDAARAEGHFVHVFVVRESQRPTPIPEPMRGALARLIFPPA
ncbi:MAG: acyl-CoA thioesterase [Hyphomicrobiaceae bacterium]